MIIKDASIRVEVMPFGATEGERSRLVEVLCDHHLTRRVIDGHLDNAIVIYFSTDLSMSKIREALLNINDKDWRDDRIDKDYVEKAVQLLGAVQVDDKWCFTFNKRLFQADELCLTRLGRHKRYWPSQAMDLSVCHEFIAYGNVTEV